jgi:ankyrin repeat protein
MIDYTSARKIVQDYLVRTDPRHFPEIVIVDDETVELDYGWMIEFRREVGDEKEDGVEFLTGRIVVMKEDGTYHTLRVSGRTFLFNGQVRPWEFEALQLDSRFWKEENRNTYLAIQLVEASGRGNLSNVKHLLEQGVSPNSTNHIGEFPLMEAAMRTDIPIVEYLLAKGAEADLAGYGGRTALFYAAEENNSRLVRKLLQAGASVNLRDDECNSVLHVSVTGSGRAALIRQFALHTRVNAFGYGAMLRWLVRAGADVNSVNHAGQTPLMLAGKDGRDQAVKFLLKNGADVSMRDTNGWTALDYALELIISGEILKWPYDYHAREQHKTVELLKRAGAVSGIQNT